MKIWIDLDHTPHVPLFRLLIPELQRRGAEVLLTARDFAQTVALCRLWNLPVEVIGHHGGKAKWRKVLNLATRSGQLVGRARRAGVHLAVSHGSRTQAVAARMLNIPCVVMMDYEYTETGIFNRFADYLLLPALIPEERLAQRGFRMAKVRRYNAYKEELYLPAFQPEPAFREHIGVPDDAILLTLRPSAREANYHDPLSEQIICSVLERALNTPGVYPLVVCRTTSDRAYLQDRFGTRVHFLDKAVDGLQLIWQSDVFVSGGGTMNREAALLGVPVYSVFTGRKPFLDEHLATQGRLTFVDRLDKVEQISFQKRHIAASFSPYRDTAIKEVADLLLALANAPKDSSTQ